MMGGAVKRAMIPAVRGPLLGILDPVVAREIVMRIELFAGTSPPVTASTLERLGELAARTRPPVIFLDDDLVRGAPLAEALPEFTAVAPVVLLAPLERQAEAAPLVADGDLDFVARAGDFVPLVAGLIERRMRWAKMSESLLGPPWASLPSDLGEIFRHEINNPLTGILGNAELVLSHRDGLSDLDVQRLQTVVSLAVRLRETIRRLSDAWENSEGSLKSA